MSDGILPEFTVSSERLSSDSYLLRVTGELDLYTAPQLENEFVCMLRDGAAYVLVDLREVPFLDSSGLGVLLAAANRLGKDGLVLTGLGIESRRVLEITGADRLLTLVDVSPSGAPA
ncbi:MAG: STAS domain-containing protein [Thermoleophilia bacterium]|nr:STAS domain-containing protein [Thermoleophilia bacterium]